MKKVFFTLILLTSLSLLNFSYGQRNPEAGALFYASYLYRSNTQAITNPHIIGAFYQIYWSEIETSDSVYNWSVIESQMQAWRSVGKKIALRIMWSSSGYWADPSANKPTPQWVINSGARIAFHQPSQTEIPLIWDPIYQRYAMRFLREVARRFDNDTTILFLDVTPGAETNPYRFGTIDQIDPSFRQVFLSTPASDGRTYNDTLWKNIVQRYIDSSALIFNSLPLLVTLNNGGMPGSPNRLIDFGNYAVARGLFVGQNGLRGSSYSTSSNSKTAFLNWAIQTKNFFEMVASTNDTSVGTLMEVVQASLRVRCSYLNIYATDVLKGTRGHPTFDPNFESALIFAASQLTGGTTSVKTEQDIERAVSEFSLEQNFPNPFNPVTKINYQVPVTNHVSLIVYDLLGRKIVTLVDEVKLAGKYDVTLDASNLPSGVYFYKLQVENFSSSRKMILLR